MLLQNKIPFAQLLILFLLLTNAIALFNYELFQYYSTVSIYFNLCVLIFILIIGKKIEKQNFLDAIYSLLFFVYGLFAIMLNNGGLGSVVTGVYALIIITVFTNTKIDNFVMKIIFTVYLLLFIYYFFQSENALSIALQNDNVLNSNTVGQIIMYTSMYIVIFLKSYNSKFKNAFSIFIFLTGLVGTMRAESRGAMVTLLIFGILDFIVPKKVFYKRKSMLFIFLLLTIIGVLFPYIYISMYREGLFIEFSFTDKTFFSGRELIWMDLMSAMKTPQDWLVGIGSDELIFSGVSQNLHNTYLVFLTNFGIIGFLLFYSFILKKISYIYNYQITNTTISYLIGFIAVFINGNFETTFLWIPMIFFPILFLVFAYNSASYSTSLLKK